MFFETSYRSTRGIWFHMAAAAVFVLGIPLIVLCGVPAYVWFVVSDGIPADVGIMGAVFPGCAVLCLVAMMFALRALIRFGRRDLIFALLCFGCSVAVLLAVIAPATPHL
jgi:hypothetical protein